MSSKLPVTTHVILDIGQTIIGVIPPIELALHDYARRNGKEWTGKICMAVESLAVAFETFLIDIKDESYKYPDKFKDFIYDIMKEVFKMDVKLMPGALKLVTHLHEHNIPMAFATDGEKELTNSFLKHAIGLDLSLFSHSVAGADDPEVKINKPAPDVYLVCAKRFKPPPKSLNNCVIFEDSIKGITGAVASNMNTVFINDMPLDQIGDIADKITVIVDSLENFRPESIGLPPYK